MATAAAFDLAAISYGSCLIDRLKDCAEMNDECPSHRRTISRCPADGGPMPWRRA
jgi:hypothetical protein